MLSPPEEQQQQSKNPLSHFLENISSYDGNVMLAAVVSLLLVILFVLLLHVYAKWFLQQARHRRRTIRRGGDPSSISMSMSMSVSNVLRPGRFHHFHTFPFDNNSIVINSHSPTTSKGLEASTIASIPLFVYSCNKNNDDDHHGVQDLECVVCLSVFEESDVGRCLPKCGHSFHVECIDMWLHSHTNCPICRAPVVPEKVVAAMEVHDDLVFDDNGGDSVEAGAELVEIVVVEQGRESNCEISDHDRDQIPDVGLLNHDRISSPSSSSSSGSSSSSSSLGSSLKRMLSRNSRSDHQCKIFPSSDNANVELND